MFVKIFGKNWDAGTLRLDTQLLAGLNFSFKLDENDNPIYLSKHVNKVVIQKDPNNIGGYSITLLTTEGVIIFI